MAIPVKKMYEYENLTYPTIGDKLLISQDNKLYNITLETLGIMLGGGQNTVISDPSTVTEETIQDLTTGDGLFVEYSGSIQSIPDFNISNE